MRRDIFLVIADPTQPAIIGLLGSQAITPNALSENFHTSMQANSHHIKVLNEYGLLSCKQIGIEIYYQVQTKKTERNT